jgi:hypothetical protein
MHFLLRLLTCPPFIKPFQFIFNGPVSPIADAFVITNTAAFVVTQRGTNVVAKDYV